MLDLGGCSSLLNFVFNGNWSNAFSCEVQALIRRIFLSGYGILVRNNIPIIPVVPTEVPIAPADPLVALKVGAVFVISPTEVLDLVDYLSSSAADPSEDSLHVEPKLPLVSPFLCSDDSEADNESEPAEQRPVRHESLTPSSKFPLVPVVAPPRDSSTASDSCGDILSSSLFKTHLGLIITKINIVQQNLNKESMLLNKILHTYKP
nr:hypothetical protein [Tanacetum cinerariifolium]